ncbi:DUF4209 domain-containing protein [Ekhidna sp.]|uniref:DUF4209 domain-containing protein n=1 Tax=Ekhidna sp. TaxID=2608089 RepID=UPI003B5B969F
MRAKEIDIDEFNSIEDLYVFIDNNAFELEKNWDLTDLWVKFRNSTSSDTEKEMAQWEIDCHLFEVKGGQIFSQIYGSSDDESRITTFPNLSDLQERVINYVTNRAKNSNNPLLKAKYFHLLWCAPKGVKNNRFASSAIENYISSIDRYCQILKSKNDDEIPIQIGKLYENTLAISNQIKVDKQILQTLTKTLLFDIEGIKFYTKDGILNDMLEYPKLFKALDFDRTLELYEAELKESKEKKDDFLLVNYHLPTAIKIATKTKNDVKRWHNEIGLTYLRMAANETQEDRFWIKQDYHSKAISAFRLAGNKTMKLEAEKLYADLKPKVRLSNVKIDFDEETRNTLKLFNDGIKELTESILKSSSENIYRTISSGYFFPKYGDVLAASEDKENAFLNFVTTIRFDKNQNITKSKGIEAEQEQKLLETYSYQVRMALLPYLHYIIVPGIKSGHLTFENLIYHLAKNSWIGKDYAQFDLGGEEKNVNWIALLTPSIVEFFLQIQGWVSSKYYRPNFILCVDSTTLKIEGLLREFCRRLNIPTSSMGPKGMQEIYLHNVLDNEEFRKYFNEDDILFFKYLFSNEGGLNLRNNVAHSFYDHNEYHPDQMFLLLAALLRLAKYDLKQTN